MNKRITTSFFLLVLAQGLHSIEEYLGSLWEVFLPAKVLSGIVSDNHEAGFMVINTGLFIFGLWCWFFPVRRNYSFAEIFLWFWIIIEIINGIGHLLWALYEGAYVPGAATALLLLVLAILLSRTVLKRNQEWHYTLRFTFAQCLSIFHLTFSIFHLRVLFIGSISLSTIIEQRYVLLEQQLIFLFITNECVLYEFRMRRHIIN